MWPSFLNFGMAGWAAAASAPIIIHLLSRRRYRQRRWAAMKYLLEAVKKSSRRLRLEQLLLLAIRTLLILLIALAVMQPYTEIPGGTAPATGERAHKVIVVDGSFSMAWQSSLPAPEDSGRPASLPRSLPASRLTLFERAQQTARQIVTASAKGDGFTLLVMSDPPREVIRIPALEPAEVLQEIDNLSLPHTSADLPATMQRVSELLRRARREKPQLGRQEVYFLSDLTQPSWQSAGDRPEILRQFQRDSQDAIITVIDLGESAADNLAVTGLRATRSYATTAEPLGFVATLENFGRQTVTGQKVEFRINGELAAEKTVRIEPRVPQSVSFNYQFLQPGEALAEVSLVGDRLAVDNHRLLPVPIKESVRVLLIDGEQTGSDLGAMSYLRQALLAQREQQASVFQPDVRFQTALQEAGLLDAYDAVILANVPLFDAADAQQIADYVRSGGGLIVFLGDQVEPESYNRWLGGEDPMGHSLLPMRIGPRRQAETRQKPFYLEEVDHRHEMLDVFRGNQRVRLVTGTVREYFQLQALQPPATNQTQPNPTQPNPTQPNPTQPNPTQPNSEKSAASQSRTAVRLSSGDPLVVTRPAGRGRVVLFATAVDRNWTGLPVRPLWVPLIHETVAFATGGQATGRSSLAGEAIGGILPAEAAEARATVARPDSWMRRYSGSKQPAEPIPLSLDGQVVRYAESDTSISGAYAFQFGPPVASTQLFTVNVDPRESDLQKLSATKLAEDVWPGVRLTYLTAAPEQQSGVGGSAAPSHRPWHPYLLGAALALLFLETLLAWRFAHHD